MGIFSGINKARQNKGGVYIEPGVYTLEVNKVIQKVSRAKDTLFIAEFTVLASSNPDRPVGTSVSWCVKIDDAYLDTCLGNINAFVAALYGIPEADVTEQGLEEMVSADNPAAGTKIRAEAFNSPKKNGDDFTKVVFSTYKE